VFDGFSLLVLVGMVLGVLGLNGVGKIMMVCVLIMLL